MLRTESGSACFCPRTNRHTLGRAGRISDEKLRPYLASKQPMAGGPGSAADVAEAAALSL